MGPRPSYSTLNGSALLVPVWVVTVILREPRAADLPTRKVAVAVVEFTTTTLLTATSPPCTLTVAGLVKLVPLSVTVAVPPRLAPSGVSYPSVGLAGTGAVTVNGCAALVPPLVPTVTL